MFCHWFFCGGSLPPPSAVNQMYPHCDWRTKHNGGNGCTSKCVSNFFFFPLFSHDLFSHTWYQKHLEVQISPHIRQPVSNNLYLCCWLTAKLQIEICWGITPPHTPRPPARPHDDAQQQSKLRCLMRADLHFYQTSWIIALCKKIKAEICFPQNDSWICDLWIETESKWQDVF